MELDDQTDQNSVYDVPNKIEATNPHLQNELESFARFSVPKGDT